MTCRTTENSIRAGVTQCDTGARIVGPWILAEHRLREPGPQSIDRGLIVRFGLQRMPLQVVLAGYEAPPFILIGTRNHRHLIELAAGKRVMRRLSEHGPVHERIDRAR